MRSQKPHAAQLVLRCASRLAQVPGMLWRLVATTIATLTSLMAKVGSEVEMR